MNLQLHKLNSRIPSGKFARTTSMATAALLATTMILSGCGKSSDAPAPTTARAQKPVPVILAPVQHRAVPIRVEVVGTLYGLQETTLSAKVSGQVVQQLKDLGDRVAGGEVLARIDPTDYKLAVAQAEVEVLEPLAELGLKEVPAGDPDFAKLATVRRAQVQADNAKAHLDRASQLFNQKPPVISQQEFADVQTAYLVALQDYDVAVLNARSQIALARVRQSQLDAARKRLADTELKAPEVARQVFPKALTSTVQDPVNFGQPSDKVPPFTVYQRLVSQGEYVHEGTPMYRVVLDSWLIFRGAAPEQMAGKIQVGQAASLHMESMNQDFTGIVSRVSPAVDVDSRTFQVEIMFNNHQFNLLPGSFARVQVITGVEPDVLHVPDSAVYSFAGVDKIFGVKDTKAVEYRIRRGSSDGSWTAVRGDKPIDVTQIIDSNLDKLNNGTPVTIEPPPQPASHPVEPPQ